MEPDNTRTQPRNKSGDQPFVFIVQSAVKNSSPAGTSVFGRLLCAGGGGGGHLRVVRVSAEH